MWEGFIITQLPRICLARKYIFFFFPFFISSSSFQNIHIMAPSPSPVSLPSFKLTNTNNVSTAHETDCTNFLGTSRSFYLFLCAHNSKEGKGGYFSSSKFCILSETDSIPVRRHCGALCVILFLILNCELYNFPGKMSLSKKTFVSKYFYLSDLYSVKTRWNFDDNKNNDNNICGTLKGRSRDWFRFLPVFLSICCHDCWLPTNMDERFLQISINILFLLQKNSPVERDQCIFGRISSGVVDSSWTYKKSKASKKRGEHMEEKKNPFYADEKWANLSENASRKIGKVCSGNILLFFLALGSSIKIFYQRYFC